MSLTLITGFRTKWLLVKITWRNVVTEAFFLVTGKHYHDECLGLWKFSLYLKFKLHHETFLMLTHISTALTMHWGNQQLDRAEGLGSFVSGKEFGSSTCSTSTVYSEIHSVSLKGFVMWERAVFHRKIALWSSSIWPHFLIVPLSGWFFIEFSHAETFLSHCRSSCMDLCPPLKYLNSVFLSLCCIPRNSQMCVFAQNLKNRTIL